LLSTPQNLFTHCNLWHWIDQSSEAASGFVTRVQQLEFFIGKFERLGGQIMP
jgi:hypothetical protein